MPPEEKENRKPIKSLRTYQGDVEEAMAKNKTSTTTVFVAEQKRKEEAPAKVRPISDGSTRNSLFTILGLSLFLLGVIAIGVVYYNKVSEKVVIEQTNKALVTFSKEDDLIVASSTRSQIVSAIVAKKNALKLPVNSVLYVNAIGTDNSQTNISDLLYLLGPNMPPSLARSFENKYMIGVYSFDTNEVFIILTTKDYATSYSGMLKWEENMESDLGRIFGLAQNASTTNMFSDEALKNKDLRILKDENGKTTLLYSFIDKNTLVITKNENIFSALVGKYQISQQVR